MRRPASTPPELPGYTFDRVLGSGGFSDVFLYRQHLPKRRVAVKVLLTEELTAANRAAFVAEANLMAQLSAHPYIVTIYHADVASDDRPYFVMEYCSGASLADRYKRETIPVADALRTGVRLASAVATAHSVGILHRDIKPANVLTNDFGWPALTDFGISAAVDDEALPVQTQTIPRGGTETTGSTESQSIGMSVPWSPPEMFEGDPKPDVRSDVFSLAATIYTILAGHTPFEVPGRSNGTLDLIGRIERGAITAIERPDLPASLVPVLHKGMASDRRDRFDTAVDFARALQRVEMELGYAPTPIDVPNLAVEAVHRDEAEDAADATRARGVATIDAQPSPAAARLISPPPASPAAASSSAGAAADATQLRGAQRVEAQPAELPAATVIRHRVSTPAVEPEVTKEAQEEAPRGRASRVIVWGASVAAAVVVIAIVVSIVIFGVPSEPGKTAPTAQGAGAGSAVVDTIPAPTLVSAQAEGSTVVFTVKNPKPKAGDTFVWKRTDRTTDAPMRATSDATISVDGYEPGGTVCVEVGIRRAGQVSAEPLQACYPK
ncbi:serine/threonine-protein kinase [Parafrigoribacterium soli]|uniref:serine/threonine-protein kinase n=1 Tax=Parafrigoribacterium soli TaxID=3144663 RepID=UPI0032EAC372